MKTLVAGCLFSLIMLFAHHAEGRIWNVMQSGGGDALTIQAGIDSASVGDCVVVECGTYYERDIRMKAGIRLVSSTGFADCTIIDAENRNRIMSCEGLDAQSPGTTAEIEGFTLTRGIAYCRQNTPWPNEICNGGGMLIEGSSVAIAKCTFVDNWGPLGVDDFSSSGGGVYCENSTVTLRSCKFLSNGAISGGGLACNASSVVLTSCTFDENSNDFMSGDGGGLASSSSDVTLTRCLFSRNEAGRGSGFCAYGGNVTVDKCTFFGNSSSSGACIQLGPEGVLTLRNTIIAFGTQGGALDRSILAADVTLTCCDIYGNAGGDWTGAMADLVGVNGNFSLNPLFCDPDNDAFTLRDTSPCVTENHPEGYNCGGYIGAFFVHCSDIGITPTTWGRIKGMFH